MLLHLGGGTCHVTYAWEFFSKRGRTKHAGIVYLTRASDEHVTETPLVVAHSLQCHQEEVVPVNIGLSYLRFRALDADVTTVNAPSNTWHTGHVQKSTNSSSVYLQALNVRRTYILKSLHSFSRL